MRKLLCILLQVLITAIIIPKPAANKLIKRQSQFIESSTNIEYIYLNGYNDYRLYKLIQRYGSASQMSTANNRIEKYLQESFETPNRSYGNVIQYCGMTMLAYFARNVTLSTENIHALLLARSEASDNSQYICFLSVLKEHRERGLGTRLLNEMINQAIQAKNSRVSLHVNTENTNAISLYVKCGMRCNNFIPDYYFGDRTYATQNAFSMVLQLKNVRNATAVCQSPMAIEISQQEEANYRKNCPQILTG